MAQTVGVLLGVNPRKSCNQFLNNKAEFGLNI